jgi:hypothetical protein
VTSEPNTHQQCYACGAPVVADNRFCPNCGAPRPDLDMQHSAARPGGWDPAWDVRRPRGVPARPGFRFGPALLASLIVLGMLGALAFGPRLIATFGNAVTPTCSVGLTGAAVSVTVEGISADAQCRSMLTRTTDGGSWYLYSGGQSPSGAVICQVTLSNDLYTGRDQGSFELYGSQICSNLIALAHPPESYVSIDPSTGPPLASPGSVGPVNTWWGLRVVSHDATVIGRGGGCQAFSSSYPPADGRWTGYDATRGAPPGDHLVCSGTFSGAVFDVWDSGGTYYASDLCTRLGWPE